MQLTHLGWKYEFNKLFNFFTVNLSRYFSLAKLFEFNDFFDKDSQSFLVFSAKVGFLVEEAQGKLGMDLQVFAASTSRLVQKAA